METLENKAAQAVDHHGLVVPSSDWEEYETPKFADITESASAQRVEEHLRFCLDGHPDSELWGENGLIAATMRCVEAVGKIEDLVTTDHESKESFIARVRSILGHNVDGEAIPVTEPERLRPAKQVPKLAARIQQSR